jgi:hypothetical protein
MYQPVADETQSKMTELIEQVQSSRLTYLSTQRLMRIAQTCTELERKGIGGLFIQPGCALGGSAIITSPAKRQTRRLEVFDLFGTIPAPSARDGPEVHERYAVISSGHSVGIGGDLARCQKIGCSSQQFVVYCVDQIDSGFALGRRILSASVDGS